MSDYQDLLFVQNDQIVTPVALREWYFGLATILYMKL